MGINLQRSGKQTYSDKPDLSASTANLINQLSAQNNLPGSWVDGDPDPDNS